MSPGSSRSLPASAGCIDPNRSTHGARQARFLVWRETLLKSTFWREPAGYGAGMRSLLVILIFLALPEPAAACRRFSIWHYNFPQPPCPIASPEACRNLCRPRLTSPAPTWTEINWGETGDGRLTAIGKLRDLSSGR